MIPGSLSKPPPSATRPPHRDEIAKYTTACELRRLLSSELSSYAGLLPADDPDQGVPVGQVLSPAYLFQRGGGRSSRPVIGRAPF